MSKFPFKAVSKRLEELNGLTIEEMLKYLTALFGDKVARVIVSPRWAGELHAVTVHFFSRDNLSTPPVFKNSFVKDFWEPVGGVDSTNIYLLTRKGGTPSM